MFLQLWQYWQWSLRMTNILRGATHGAILHDLEAADSHCQIATNLAQKSPR